MNLIIFLLFSAPKIVLNKVFTLKLKLASQKKIRLSVKKKLGGEIKTPLIPSLAQNVDKKNQENTYIISKKMKTKNSVPKIAILKNMENIVKFVLLDA